MIPRLVAAALLGAAVILFSGCRREEIKVYRVAKEPHVHQPGEMPHDHPQTGGTGETPGSALPKLTYKAPEGWEEVTPGQMRVASFRVKSGDKVADLGVVPLPGLAGGDLGNVNRWRSQVGLPAVTEDELDKLKESVQVAGHEAQVYDLAGEDQAGEKSRVVAAIVHHEGVAWFFKLVGDDQVVAQSKPAFLEFLKSVNFESVQPDLPPSHPPIDAASVAAQSFPQEANGSKPSWEVPAGWVEAPAGQFLVAKYTVSGSGTTQAAVNVSMSAGEGGGLVGNVNRWRRQAGLAEESEEQIRKATTSLETAAGKVSLVTIGGTDPKTGEKIKVVGAILPQQGRTWFYKLMGSEGVVDQQVGNFTNFIKSAKYPSASSQS